MIFTISELNASVLDLLENKRFFAYNYRKRFERFNKVYLANINFIISYNKL